MRGDIRPYLAGTYGPVIDRQSKAGAEALATKHTVMWWALNFLGLWKYLKGCGALEMFERCKRDTLRCASSMAEYTTNEPLLSNVLVKDGSGKQTAVSICFLKWSLKFLMWVIFTAWAALMFLFPSEFVQDLFRKWILASRDTVFGLPGSLLLIFSGPVIIVALLSVVYLAIFPKESDMLRKSKFPRFRMWTFPVLVDGLFGVVSAAELIGILLFVAYVLWAVSAYMMQTHSLVSKFSLPSLMKSCLMLEVMGLRFGSIGLFCMGFLFLPVARGSVLLRLIDIPFEHAAKYHVWLGHLTMMLFTLHGVFYVIAWALQGKLLHELFEWRNIGVANLAGVISLLAGILMWLTSLHPVRKHYFELFFYTHQLYIVFVVFLALHVGDFIFSMAAGPIFLFILDRFLRFCQSRRTVDMISARCLPCGTVELIFSKPPNMKYNALSFIFVQVRELSFLQWHPFSVSSSPLDGEHHIAVLIKVLGEWTRNLRDKITSMSEQFGKGLPIQSCQQITASVEGPYGHECAYHLTYENLILVAGGIGISPFLAILSDILHRIREKKPCLPKNVLVVWAVKKTEELSLLSMVDANSICSCFPDKLNLEVQTYVTQETEPPLENGISHKINNSGSSEINGSQMSNLVGTGNIIWSGAYIVMSTVGFVIIFGLMEAFYIKPFGISSWWYQGLLLLIYMIGSVGIFGGLVIFLWNLWENKVSMREACCDKKGKPLPYDRQHTKTSACQMDLVSLGTTIYGLRPNFQAIFNSVAESWGHDDVGVIVCGPPSLQTSVAKECRSQNLKWRRNHPIFHFNSHSFDL